MVKYIWVRGRRLFYYDTYFSWNRAYKIAKYYQKKIKNNYFILTTEDFLTGAKKYRLYMNKVIHI